MIQLGELQLHLINDADTRVDPGGAFGLVPRVLWSRYTSFVDSDESRFSETVITRI